MSYSFTRASAPSLTPVRSTSSRLPAAVPSAKASAPAARGELSMMIAS